MSKNTTYCGVNYDSRLHAIDLLKNAIKWIESLDNDECVEKCRTNDCDALKLIEISLGNRLS